MIAVNTVSALPCSVWQLTIKLHHTLVRQKILSVNRTWY